MNSTKVKMALAVAAGAAREVDRAEADQLGGWTEDALPEAYALDALDGAPVVVAALAAVDEVPALCQHLVGMTIQ